MNATTWELRQWWENLFPWWVWLLVVGALYGGAWLLIRWQEKWKC